MSTQSPVTNLKTLSEKPFGYLIAAAGGIAGGPLGLVVSPLVLFGFNKLLRQKGDKRPNRFRAWALTGILGAPLCLALTYPATNTPQNTSSSLGQQIQQQSQGDANEGAGVSLANFLKLQTGISYTQAVRILGSEGTEISSSEIAGYKTVMYKWDGKGEFGANMNATFQDGRLISKAQFGLK